MGHEPDRLPPSKVDLLLYAPCPVKLAVKDQVDLIALEMRGRGEDVSIHIPMGCTSIDPYDPLYQETDPDRLPAIIASIGFGDFWREKFVERFVRPGMFETVLPPRINPMIEPFTAPPPIFFWWIPTGWGPFPSPAPGTICSIRATGWK